jgi:hypothetical protein
LNWEIVVKIKYIQRITIALLVFLLVTGLFFGDVLESRAQSSQIWSDPINLSNAGSSTNPAIVIDAAGMIHVVWFDQFEGYKYTNSTDGDNWTTPDDVRFPFSPASLVSPENSSPPEAPIFLADKNGGIHAFWREKTNALYYSKASPSPDLTTNWTNRLKLADSVVDFNAVVSSQGIVHIGYISNLGTDVNPSGVYYRQLKGSSWSSPINLFSSQYYRASNPEDANVSLTVYEANEVETVYMVWDDRAQKRILLSKSTDTGSSWGEAREVIVTDSNSGFSVPFNVEINTLDEGLLMMWQVGDPGIRCTQYSKWSSDGGESWDAPIRMFDEFAVCPEKSEFISIDPNYSVALLSIQGDLSLIAWNGTEWSEPEIQSGLSTISNPRTFDTITFGCQQVSSDNGILYVVGCDQGAGGDTWFISRKLDSLESMFPSSSPWSFAREVTITPNRILSLTSVADQEGSIHVLWVETSTLETDQVEPKIQYAREIGGEWSQPSSVITGLNGLPAHLSVTIDNQQRLLLVWVDGNTGDLLFSWANSNRANIPLEWTKPIILPSPSNLNDAPDILVDASGQIVVVYAVALNENRGVYLTQSNDLGETWFFPVKVFDAVSAGWDGIDRPKITLTGDGYLHLLFHQVSLLGSHQTDGLYYSQSIDGGITWSPAEKVGEQLIRWSEIIGYDEQVIHRMWQQEDKSIAITFHQLSQDGGKTWDAPLNISNVAATAPEPALSIDWDGNLHFMQLVAEDNQIYQEWEWEGAHWRSLETRKFNFEDQNIPLSIKAGVTPKGSMYALILFERSDLKDEFESKLLNTSRSLNLTGSAQSPSIASIAIPVVTSIPTESSDIQSNPTPLSPLADLAEPPPSGIKNIIGLILVISAALIILVFLLPRRKKPLK